MRWRLRECLQLRPSVELSSSRRIFAGISLRADVLLRRNLDVLTCEGGGVSCAASLHSRINSD
jgi:hypothetical protein